MTPRLSLLGKFSGLSLVAMLALALIIGTVLQRRIETRALRGAEQLAGVIGHLTVAPLLMRSQLAGTLPPEKIAELDRALAGVSASGVRLRHVKLFAPDGRLVYADEHERIGDQASPADFRSALAGAVVSDVERKRDDSGRRSDTKLEVYTPLRLVAGGSVAGVLEIYGGLGQGSSPAPVRAPRRPRRL
jgi:hypothetical protein